MNADLLTPVSAFLSVAGGERDAFLLESVEGGERIGRYTFLGARPYLILTARGAQIEIRRGRRIERRSGPLLPVVRELLAEHTPAQMPGLPPFTAGAVGYVSYDVVRQFESLPTKAKDDTKLPDCVLMFYDRVLAFDHVRHQIHIMAAADVRRESPKKAYERATRDIAALERRLATGLKSQKLSLASTEATTRALKVKARTDRKDFLKSVKRAKEYITAGDIFQVVLSQRFDFTPKATPFEIYRALTNGESVAVYVLPCEAAI